MQHMIYHFEQEEKSLRIMKSQKSFRPFMLIVLVAITALVIAACGGGAAPTEEPAPAVEEEAQEQPAEEEAAEEEVAEEAAAEEESMEEKAAAEAETEEDDEEPGVIDEEGNLASADVFGTVVDTDEPDVSTLRDKVGGEYRTVQSSDAVSFHPYITSDASSSSYQAMVYSGDLINVDENTLEYIPYA